VAYLTFDHACKWAEKLRPQQQLSVCVRTTDGTDTPLDISTWPTGKDWTFINSGRTDLNRFAGNKIRLVFRYTSTSDEACTWEIKNLILSAMGRQSGIEQLPDYIRPELDNSTQPVEYYTTDGRQPPWHCNPPPRHRRHQNPHPITLPHRQIRKHPGSGLCRPRCFH
jgi:hypothetical protein